MLFCFPHLQDSCPRTLRLSVIRVAMYAFIVTTILMTACGNLLVIISISYFRQLHSPTNFIIFSLAMVDCSLGCFIMPFSMVRSVEGCWYLGKHFCKIHSSLDMMLCSTSVMHLCLVSVDRYWAISQPLQYKTKITTFKILLFVVIIWMFSFIFSFGVVFSEITSVGLEMPLNPCVGSCALIANKQWAIINALVLFFIPGTVMVSVYMRIFHIANKHVRVISNRMATVNCHELKNQTSEQRERKAAKTLALVVIVFILCWMPFFITIVVDPFLNFLTPVNIFDALIWFAYFNSVCNPVIYAFFYPNFRKAFKIIMAKMFGLKNASHVLQS
ncbi:trace amine-associated receptor 4-like [Chanos chanos]|uniref:Trace amine-associated receptor 4-like n=1 Tax=Chanos chanos TaxID=29144 RepID=A0A6J2W0D3_CHACN|nr:trace amine-associated receptor 4-like [Chanos chanos]